jgi:hypothetical protein
MDDLKAHKFFNGIDFNSLHLQKAPTELTNIISSISKTCFNNKECTQSAEVKKTYTKESYTF